MSRSYRKNPILELQEDELDAQDEAAPVENPDAPADTEKELVVDENKDNADDFERLLNNKRECRTISNERPRTVQHAHGGGKAIAA